MVTNSAPAAQERHALAVRLNRVAPHALALYDHLAEAGRRNADCVTALRLVEAAGGPTQLGDFWTDMDEHLWTFLKRKQDHDPTPDLLGLRCPHLATFGGVDPLIPVTETAARLTEAACHPARPREATLTASVFPNADHRIQVGTEATPAPGYLDTVSHWLTTHTA
ncbi:hypothetical protein ACGFZL_29100 [Streptomyces sp. NPDC048182]|uniref:hypothetical protein n=1 Tax=Streptomyces sp. NPDC048182 TaxID=3365507 RepID=UPI00371C1C64